MLIEHHSKPDIYFIIDIMLRLILYNIKNNKRWKSASTYDIYLNSLKILTMYVVPTNKSFKTMKKL